MEQKGLNTIAVSIAGVGGQGILTIGRLLVEAAMPIYKYVVYFPLYSGTMRGGMCECTVSLSNVASPAYTTLNPSATIIMSSAALKEYEKRVRPGGLVILDSFIVTDKVSRGDVKVFYIPATGIALDIGNRQVANLVLLGAYLEITKILTVESVEKALEERLGGTRRAKLLSFNKEALRRGAIVAANYKG